MSEWFENEHFWIELYPSMFPEERMDAAEEALEQVFELVDFDGSTVLDLCCGPGRFAMAAARKGLAVTGVDKTPFLLNKAKERAAEHQLEVEWILEDMRTFTRPKAYDLVLNMFTSFGYFDDKQDDMKVLRNIYQSLKPGGVCVLEMMGKEILARIFRPTNSERFPDGTLLVQRHEIFDDWTRIRNEWLVIKDEHARSFRFHHTIYSGQELRDRLRQVGFSTIKLYGELDGAAYNYNAVRLIAVAWK